MELYIIRHAQSFNNALTDSADRVSDPPLTALGERQAALLGTYLARPPADSGQPGLGATYVNRTGFHFTRLFTSAMRRSLQTAASIGGALGRQPEVWVDIHETGGVFLDHHEGRGLPGITRAEMEEQFPRFRLPPEVTEDGWWNREQETEEQWQERAARVATKLRDRYAATDARIGLVTHGGFAHALLHTLFQLTLPPTVIFPHLNTAISRLDFSDEGTIVVQYYNRVDHLPSELLT
ncbi:MAG: hypothetical protein CL878_11465 [Dehalococcoidia bacterium]|nr:hypothetical protein [Dehalococcoidia bacterium]